MSSHKLLRIIPLLMMLDVGAVTAASTKNNGVTNEVSIRTWIYLSVQLARHEICRIIVI